MTNIPQKVVFHNVCWIANSCACHQHFFVALAHNGQCLCIYNEADFIVHYRKSHDNKNITKHGPLCASLGMRGQLNTIGFGIIIKGIHINIAPHPVTHMAATRGHWAVAVGAAIGAPRRVRATAGAGVPRAVPAPRRPRPRPRPGGGPSVSGNAQLTCNTHKANASS